MVDFRYFSQSRQGSNEGLKLPLVRGRKASPMRGSLSNSQPVVISKVKLPLVMVMVSLLRLVGAGTMSQEYDKVNSFN